jgi:hypothetical protein
MVRKEAQQAPARTGPAHDEVRKLRRKFLGRKTVGRNESAVPTWIPRCRYRVSYALAPIFDLINPTIPVAAAQFTASDAGNDRREVHTAGTSLRIN